MLKVIGDPQQGLSNEIKQWLESEDGQQTLRNSLSVVEQAITELQEARRIDENTLHQPFTI